MRKILLATTAAALLSVPAIAADQGQHNQMQPNTQSQAPSSSQWNNQRQAAAIAPSDLNAQQISDMQRALNQRGLDAGSVDGVWGPETAAAVRTFQEREGIQASGATLNHQTLSALGVSAAGGMQPGISSGDETTGSGSDMNAPAGNVNTPQPSDMNRNRPSGSTSTDSNPPRQ